MKTKDKILYALLDLASKNGMHKTSMNMIANEVKIKKASLYYYFSSKEEMVKEMYETFRNENTCLKPLDFEMDIEEIVVMAFRNYLSLCNEEKMKKVFIIVESEKFIDDIAKKIYLEETHTMLKSTIRLFEKIQEIKHVKIINLETFSEAYCLYAHELILLSTLNDSFYNEKRCVLSIKQFIKEFMKVER